MPDPPQRSQIFRWSVCLLGATVLPPLIVVGDELIAGSHQAPSAGWGLAIAMLVGLVVVWQCPIRIGAKILACVLYGALMGVFLFGTALECACSIHQRCL